MQKKDILLEIPEVTYEYATNGRSIWSFDISDKKFSNEIRICMKNSTKKIKLYQARKDVEKGLIYFIFQEERVKDLRIVYVFKPGDKKILFKFYFSEA